MVCEIYLNKAVTKKERGYSEHLRHYGKLLEINKNTHTT